MLMWSQMVHVLCWSEVTSDMQFPFAIHSVTNLMCHVRDTLARTARKGKHRGNRNRHSGSRVPQERLLVPSHWILCLLEGIAVGSSCFCPTVSTAATQNCGIAGFSCHREFVGQCFPVNCSRCPFSTLFMASVTLCDIVCTCCGCHVCEMAASLRYMWVSKECS